MQRNISAPEITLDLWGDNHRKDYSLKKNWIDEYRNTEQKNIHAPWSIDLWSVTVTKPDSLKNFDGLFITDHERSDRDLQ